MFSQLLFQRSGILKIFGGILPAVWFALCVDIFKFVAIPQSRALNATLSFALCTGLRLRAVFSQLFFQRSRILNIFGGILPAVWFALCVHIFKFAAIPRPKCNPELCTAFGTQA